MNGGTWPNGGRPEPDIIEPSPAPSVRTIERRHHLGNGHLPSEDTRRVVDLKTFIILVHQANRAPLGCS
jgi:hypothetical protein